MSPPPGRSKEGSLPAGDRAQREGVHMRPPRTFVEFTDPEDKSTQ